MLARYRINKAKYMKGGNKVEYAPAPKGGFEVPPIEEKHSSMSAALQAHMINKFKILKYNNK